jgi:hypothetical protein
MSTKKAEAPKLEPPKQPLKYRVPGEGPSPREYELLTIGEQRALTEDETRELHAEQDSRQEIESAWAKYREDRGAYERAVRSGNA